MKYAPDWFMFFIIFLGVRDGWSNGCRRLLHVPQFLKVLPQRDGKSKLDWQNYWVERSRSMWTDGAEAVAR